MKNILIWVVVILLIIWGITSIDSKEESSGETIKIGAPIELSGVASAFGEMAQMGMDLAVEEINEDGGIDGRMVEIFYEDSETQPTKAVTAYRKLVDIHKVDAVIGGLFDFVAQPIFPVALEEGVTFISPINFTIPEHFEMTENSFVMYPAFEKAIRELEGVLVEEEVGKVGMVAFQSDFANEIVRVIDEILKENNKEALVIERYQEIGLSDFRTQILKLKQAEVDTVFLDTLDIDTVAFAKQARELDFNPQIISHSTLRDALLVEDIDPTLLEGAIMLDWEVTSSEFAERFEEKYGIPPRRGADGSYDAVYVLAEAIANTNSREEVPEYLETHTFETANGTVSFTEDHSVESVDVAVRKVVEGELVDINTLE